jgi:hypothetical protein
VSERITEPLSANCNPITGDQYDVSGVHISATARGFFDFVETNVEAEALGFHFEAIRQPVYVPKEHDPTAQPVNIIVRS